MHWYIKVLANYAVFRGRACREEFWFFYSVHGMISFCMALSLRILHGPEIIFSLYSLFVLIPTFALFVRRMHDTNHKAWWLLVPVYNLILICFCKSSVENNYGPSPK